MSGGWKRGEMGKRSNGEVMGPQTFHVKYSQRGLTQVNFDAEEEARLEDS
jgi:hypothetical protein